MMRSSNSRRPPDFCVGAGRAWSTAEGCNEGSGLGASLIRNRRDANDAADAKSSALFKAELSPTLASAFFHFALSNRRIAPIKTSSTSGATYEAVGEVSYPPSG